MSGEAGDAEKKTPTVLIFIGMAGSGKTSLVAKVNSVMKKLGKKTYVINLDPAVGDKLPYKPTVTITETVNYKEVMKQFFSFCYCFSCFIKILMLDLI
jgi:adenylylsulfate kinase-like enzyme